VDGRLKVVAAIGRSFGAGALRLTLRNPSDAARVRALLLPGTVRPSPSRCCRGPPARIAGWDCTCERQRGLGCAASCAAAQSGPQAISHARVQGGELWSELSLRLDAVLLT